MYGTSKRDVVYLIFMFLLVLSVGAEADDTEYYERIQKRLSESQCQDHTYNEDHEDAVTIAFSFEFCANIARIKDNDYKRGWWLHREASNIVRQVNEDIPCECELHTHADNLAYGAYKNLAEFLATGYEIPSDMLSYCSSLTPEAL